jgi:dihydrofolate reductase
MKIVLVAAVADNGVIGRDNAMPWRLKSDLKRLRARTTGRPVIMGRKTYLSIGKPLSARTNIVVSRTAGFGAPGVIVVPSVEGALDVAHGDARRRGVDEIMVLGGGRIYAAMMPVATELDITHVHASPVGDVFFPTIDPEVWAEVERTDHGRTAADSDAFTYVTYRRKGASAGACRYPGGTLFRRTPLH